MNTNSNSYVMVFAVGMCVTVGSVLASLNTVLKETQAAAAEFDRRKNVMIAAGLIARDTDKSREDLERVFEERVVEVTVDTATGQVVEDEEEADRLRDGDPLQYRKVGTAKNDAGVVDTIILPVSGKGLWSTIYGYIALKSDKKEVRGITFYKHGETPGLGGEVENPEWTAKWAGKLIRDANDALVGIIVKKGEVDPGVEAEKKHYVDGLAGATITCNGVTAFIKRDLTTFDKYLSQN
ncbi:MAG: NADH:ubiquinone reductase (Na(+)-transporting) subunit C [Planctomycetes bacterium]|nr:NADH:ubiquinone reductase (Na(+)-transporting) subunit C [Planctomycetota bacterium]